MKGRRAVGSQHQNAKLSEGDVVWLRAAATFGVPYPQIAGRLGVSIGTVCDIVKGRTWSWMKHGRPTENARSRYIAKVPPPTTVATFVPEPPPLRLPERGPARRATLRERFNAKFVVDGESGCWVWAGAKRGQYGHGHMKVGHHFVGASRVAWMLHRGEIPDGLFVCHRCDNPPCVNPEHLFLASPVENTADMIRKGRNARGTGHPNAKLTERDIVEIRDAASSGERLRSIAKRLGVAASTVADIAHRRAWRHVA